MESSNKVKKWLDENKKYVRIGGVVALSLVGYALCKNKKIPFSEEIKNWSTEKLHAEHDKYLPEFYRTNVKPFKMQIIDSELGHRATKAWSAICPPNTDLHFRWTDANRWDRD